MLDDLKLIHTRDAHDALGVAQKQWQQYQHDFGIDWHPDRPVSKVIVSGMGGSGLAAKAVDIWPGLNVPHQVLQEYNLPAYTDQSTLLVVSSYSGNTEEELSVLTEALGLSQVRKPMIVVVTEGGKLKEVAEANNLPLITIPGGLQPRMTFGYQFRALVELYKSCSLLHETVDEVNSAADWLKDKLNEWDPVLPTKSNRAKKLALDLVGKSVVIYSSTKFLAASYKWKISFNENAKNLAWFNQYSEFNHNEILGWVSHPVDKPYAVVELRSSFDHPRIIKRFEVSDQLLSGLMPAPEVINLEGDTVLKQLIWSIAFGDFVTLYLALLNGIDPTPVDLIENLKKRLN